jgi:hypothetical protein
MAAQHRAICGLAKVLAQQRILYLLYLLLFERGPTRLFAVCLSIAVREMLSIWPVTSSTTASCSDARGKWIGNSFVGSHFYLRLMSQY